MKELEAECHRQAGDVGNVHSNRNIWILPDLSFKLMQILNNYIIVWNSVSATMAVGNLTFDIISLTLRFQFQLSWARLISATFHCVTKNSKMTPKLCESSLMVWREGVYFGQQSFQCLNLQTNLQHTNSSCYASMAFLPVCPRVLCDLWLL